MNPPAPPRLARRLLKWLVAKRWREYVIGDLDEEYVRYVVPSVGAGRARLWYWSQVVRSIVHTHKEKQMKTRHRESPIGVRSWFASVLHDFRIAGRNLARSPGFTVAALLTLSLGIGASIAIFSAVNEVVLRPMSFPEPDRLVMLWESNEEREWRQVHAAPANLADWRERTASFEDIAFVNDFTSSVTLGGGTQPAQVVMSQVSGNAFSVLGVSAIVGRTFREEETFDDGLAVLSYDVWRRHFDLDPNIAGMTIRLDGRANQVLGVMPRTFRYGINDAEVWVTQSWMAERRGSVWYRQAHVIRPIARLKDGVTLTQAREDLSAVAARLEQEYVDTNVGMRAGLTPLHAFLVGDRKLVLMLLLGAVGVLQMIACANVATLLMGRAVGRQQEMAVRAALGAGRSRLVRQMLTESMVLAMAGTAVGVAVGVGGLTAIAAISPPELDGLVFRLDWRLGLLVIGICAASAVLFGALPAWRGARVDATSQLRVGQRGGTAGRNRLLAANGFVSFEVGLAVLLVAAAGLMVRSLDQLSRIDPGVDIENVLTFQLHPPSGTYPNDNARREFADAFLGRVEAIPGVVAAGAARGLPLTNYGWTSDFTIEGWSSDQFGVELRHREATPGYFAALNVPVLAGQMYNQFLGPEEHIPVVVNEAFRDQYFPSRSPVGQRISFSRAPTERSYWYPIVGVVANERMSLTTEPLPEVIAHLRGDTPATFNFAVKTTVDPITLVPAVHAALAATDAEVPLLRIRTMRDVVADARASDRFLMTLLGIFALAALTLAAVGVYGVANQAARARTREVGIRMALGAPGTVIIRGLLIRGVTFVALGIVMGVGGAFLGGDIMESMLYSVDPRDPVTLAVVALIMGAVAIGSSFWPAWRATRVDPAKVLQAE